MTVPVMQTIDAEEILTAEEAATWLKVERHTIYALIRQGRLPAIRVGRGWRIYRPDLLKLRELP